MFASSSAELLGFNGYIQPFTRAQGQDILKGVNYASAAAGIREETGQQLVILQKITLFLTTTLYFFLVYMHMKVLMNSLT